MAVATILNVDDFAPGRYLRSQNLRDAGFQVHEAATGLEALQCMRLRPALVLLDVNLPDIGGFQVCRQIRADPETSNTIVVHVSASRLSLGDHIAGLENGADLYLAGPVDGDLLVATVKALLRAHAAETEVRRSNQSLRSLTDMLSHELRQSARSVLLPAELLAQRGLGNLAAEEREIFSHMLDSAKRMSRLIEGVLSYTADSERSQISTTSAAAALRTSLEELQLLVEESGASIEFGDLPDVRSSGVSLARIFSNLITNSIKYRGVDPPHIEIHAVAQGDFWRFAVRDNGLGIEPQYHKQIFDPFKRLHGHKYEGIGIGLSLCKRLIEDCDGEIWVESQAGSGCTFYFTLPRAQGNPAPLETQHLHPGVTQ